MILTNRSNRAPAKNRLAAGETVMGVISPFASPELLRVAAAAGFELFMADGEHGALAPDDVRTLSLAADHFGIELVVRTPGLDEAYIGRCLDAGAGGIVLPHGSAASACRAVAACLYPPEGERGLGPTFANTYGITEDLEASVGAANERTLVIVQVEDASALDELDAICGVAGVDGILIGPRDMGMSLRHAGGAGMAVSVPTLDEAIDATIAAARRAGKWASLPAWTSSAVSGVAARGATLVLGYLPQLIGQVGAEFVAAGGSGGSVGTGRANAPEVH